MQIQAYNSVLCEKIKKSNYSNVSIKKEIFKSEEDRQNFQVLL